MMVGSQRTDPQSKVMKRANQFLALKIAFVVAVTAGFGGFAARGLYSAQPQAAAAGGEGAFQADLAIGRRLPAFTLQSLPNASGQTDTVTNASLAGKKTVFAIVEATCPHCQREGKALHALEPDFSQDLRYVIASVSNRSETSGYAQETGLQGSVFTGAMPLALSLKIQSVPLLFLLDDKGIIQYVQQGEVDPEQERRTFSAFLSGKPIPAAAQTGPF